eukprot:2402769-Rhodomonas_salina.2
MRFRSAATKATSVPDAANQRHSSYHLYRTRCSGGSCQPYWTWRRRGMVVRTMRSIAGSSYQSYRAWRRKGIVDSEVQYLERVRQYQTTQLVCGSTLVVPGAT